MLRKKGIQLNGAFTAVLMVVLVAVLVIIAIFLFEALGAGFVSQAATVTNESGAYINTTGYTIAAATVCNFNSPSVTGALNATDNSIIGLGNLTISSTGVITNASVVTYPTALVSYSYNWGGESCTATESMITQFVTYPALIGLLGTIIFLGLVIGVLVGSFVFGGRRDV